MDDDDKDVSDVDSSGDLSYGTLKTVSAPCIGDWIHIYVMLE